VTDDTPARRIAVRRGVPNLAVHLNHTYGIEVTEIAQLDLGVYRVDRADRQSWVARLYPAVHPSRLRHGQRRGARRGDDGAGRLVRRGTHATG
jgi:hypothetical protein